MYLDIQHFYGFMTLDSVVQQCKITQDGRNSVANFQACVEACFREHCPNLLAWMENFALFHISEKRTSLPIGHVFAHGIETFPCHLPI